MNKRNWIIGGVAAFLLLISVGLEHPYFSSHDGSWHSTIFNISSVVALMKETGFALLIALMIILGIEHSSRMADQENADKLRRVIAEDVFRGVFSRVLSKAYVDHVIDVHLQPRLVRRHFNLSLSIENVPFGWGSEAQSKRLILHRRRLSYTLVNVTSQSVSEVISQSVPQRISGFDKHVGIIKFQLARGGKTEDCLEKLVKSPSSPVAKQLNITLAPKEEISITTESIQLFNRNDHLVWNVNTASLSGDIDMVVQAENVKAYLSGRLAARLEEIYSAPDRRSGRWKVDGPVLINDGLIFSWRPQ